MHKHGCNRFTVDDGRVLRNGRRDKVNPNENDILSQILHAVTRHIAIAEERLRLANESAQIDRENRETITAALNIITGVLGRMNA